MSQSGLLEQVSCNYRTGSGSLRSIRACIAEVYDEATAEAIRIQYGGSVSAASAPELFAQPDIDGGLVGGHH